MLNREIVRQLAEVLEFDLCGIAPVSRFDEAPKGFHPRDIFPATQSVVVLARRFPEGPFHAQGPIPYTTTNDVILHEVIHATVLFCAKVERRGNVRAVPVPSEPYEWWDAERKEGRGLLSLKHAGRLAGLGFIGKNTLLTHKTYGNRICLGAVLLDIELDPDPLADYNFCLERCRLCVDACPAHAIDGVSVNQKRCRDNSENRTKKGYPVYICNTCRAICPNGAGAS